MLAIINKVYQSLLAGEPVFLATQISKSGSAPRESGSKMIIYTDGSIFGSIGGGSMEQEVILTARSLFTLKKSMLKSYDSESISVGTPAPDMSCGGHIKVLIEYIPIDDNSIELYRYIHEALENGISIELLGCIINQEETDIIGVQRSVQREDSWFGALLPSIELQQFLEQKRINKNTAALIDFEDRPYVIDSLVPPNTLFIIGAGHVAKEVAALAHEASFRTIVVDDRASLAVKERFPRADKISVCPDFTDTFSGYRIDKNSYIILVTRSHSTDKQVLAQALATKAGYIGMIGSRKKKQQIYKALESEGFNSAQLDQVHCPIGLSIGAETPFEIGVSIIAELIQHRAQESAIRL